MSALAPPAPKSAAPFPDPRKKRWTVSEFYLLSEHGFFQNARVMLLDGEIIEMPTPNPPHVMCTLLAESALRTLFGPGHVVRGEKPLPLGLWTDPIPDVAVVTGSIRDYSAHPTTALLVVEVSDTTLAIDTVEKPLLYAAAGILDYWVVDINGRQLIVFRDPVADSNSSSGFRYATEMKLDASATIAPLAAPQSTIRVADLLP